jgi:hypothetical protein
MISAVAAPDTALPSVRKTPPGPRGTVPVPAGRRDRHGSAPDYAVWDGRQGRRERYHHRVFGVASGSTGAAGCGEGTGLVCDDECGPEAFRTPVAAPAPSRVL